LFSIRRKKKEKEKIHDKLVVPEGERLQGTEGNDS